MRGIFITFEGGDGVGKSTQAQLLYAWLTEQGMEVLRTFEPGATTLGEKLRGILLHSEEKIDPRAEALLYAADRAHHIATVVKPALEAGKVVVQDRYIDSSLAYQGAGRVLNVEEVKQLSEWATGGLWPDLTVLLDLEPQKAIQRRSGRGEKADRIESEALEFHALVRQGFLSLAESTPERTLVCDAELPASQTAEIIRNAVASLLTT